MVNLMSRYLPHIIRRAALPLVALALVVVSAQANMQKLITEDTTILQTFEDQGPKIPAAVMAKAKGVVIMEITQGGLIFAGKSGEGVLLTRVGNGWSGPVAVSTSGASFGLQAGGEVIEVVLLLNSKEAVNALVNENQIKFAGEMTATAGPAQGDITDNVPLPDAYVYSRSSGAFAGISVKGSVVAIERGATNKYYGKPTSVSDILNGKVSAPASSQQLRSLLSSMSTLGSK